jgi:hypothetical protein
MFFWARNAFTRELILAIVIPFLHSVDYPVIIEDIDQEVGLHWKTFFFGIVPPELGAVGEMAIKIIRVTFPEVPVELWISKNEEKKSL